MSLTTTAHVNFRGDARQALEFYRSVFDGQVTLATYADIHAVEEPGQAEQIAWGQVVAPSGFRLMAYDVQPSKGYDAGENPFYLTLAGTDADEVTASWGALAEGGTVLAPIGPSAFGPLYGMLRDRFGVTWIISQAG